MEGGGVSGDAHVSPLPRTASGSRPLPSGPEGCAGPGRAAAKLARAGPGAGPGPAAGRGEATVQQHTEKAQT